MKAKVIGTKEDIARACLSDVRVKGVEIHTGMIIDIIYHASTLDGDTVYSFMGVYSQGVEDSWLIRSSLLEIIEE